jgi:hypothetical protein
MTLQTQRMSLKVHPLEGTRIEGGSVEGRTPRGRPIHAKEGREEW